MQDRFLYNHMTGVFRNIARGFKCSNLKLEHLADDVKALTKNGTIVPSKEAVEIVCEKYESPKVKL